MVLRRFYMTENSNGKHTPLYATRGGDDAQSAPQRRCLDQRPTGCCAQKSRRARQYCRRRRHPRHSGRRPGNIRVQSTACLDSCRARAARSASLSEAAELVGGASRCRPAQYECNSGVGLSSADTCQASCLSLSLHELVEMSRDDANRGFDSVAFLFVVPAVEIRAHKR